MLSKEWVPLGREKQHNLPLDCVCSRPVCVFLSFWASPSQGVTTLNLIEVRCAWLFWAPHSDLSLWSSMHSTFFLPAPIISFQSWRASSSLLWATGYVGKLTFNSFSLYWTLAFLVPVEDELSRINQLRNHTGEFLEQERVRWKEWQVVHYNTALLSSINPATLIDSLIQLLALRSFPKNLCYVHLKDQVLWDSFWEKLQNGISTLILEICVECHVNV